MQDSESDRLVSRRNYILGGATLLGGVGVFSLSARETKAEVAMDSLNVSGDSATLGNPPSAVTLTVTGDWQITGSTPEQTRVVLQVESQNDGRDMAEHLELDTPASGSYTLEAALLEHPSINGSDLLPESVGQEKTTEITVRIILLALSGGEIQAESFVEDTASLTLTKDGLKLEVSGSGSIQVTG